MDSYCYKPLENMTPGEATHCAYSAVAESVSRGVDKLSSITIGEWFTWIFIVLWAPSAIVIYILPIIFAGRAFGRFVQHDKYTETPEGKRRWKFWSAYMAIAGVATFLAGKPDERFMDWLAAAQIAAGGIMLIAGPSWWGIRHAADGRRLSE